MRRPLRCAPPGPARVGIAIGGAAAVAFVVAPASGQALLTQEEALRLAFPPPATVERHTAYLTEEEEAEVARRGDVEVSRSVVPYYVGRDAAGEPLGVAWFDVHRVRTLPEALMIVVAPEGTVRRVEVVKFAEPREYMASERWLAQFEGRALDGDLSVGREIVNLTGATLTSRAVTAAVRRVLALQDVVDPLAAAGPEGAGGRADAAEGGEGRP